MWGATMLDQLACRIAFRKMRYDGPFTPPSLQGTLVYPGNFGVMDWGGMAIDPVRHRLRQPQLHGVRRQADAEQAAMARSGAAEGSTPMPARRSRSC